GIDFDARTGDPVLAVGDGVVSFSGVRSGYGNVVEVDHGNGFVTRYAHNSRNIVKVGDLVRVGQEIAKAGSTGRSTGAHVHLEVWENGRLHNPRRFMDPARQLPGRDPAPSHGKGWRGGWRHVLRSHSRLPPPRAGRAGVGAGLPARAAATALQSPPGATTVQCAL